MDEEKLYVVLPCYNEEKNIRALLEKWEMQEPKLLETKLLLQLVIIDDGSSDDTLRIVNSIEKKTGNIAVIKHGTNKGLGEAINTGINYVIKQQEAGYLCIMDSDFTQHPSYIHKMLHKLAKERLDCVIASRYVKDAKVEGVSIFRKMLSLGARIVCTLTLQIPNVKDYTCGYRVYRLTALRMLGEKYKGNIVQEKGFACMLELLFKLSMEGFKMGEVPFVLKYQQKDGQSKMKILQTIGRSLMVIRSLKKLAVWS